MLDKTPSRHAGNQRQRWGRGESEGGSRPAEWEMMSFCTDCHGSQRNMGLGESSRAGREWKEGKGGKNRPRLVLKGKGVSSFFPRCTPHAHARQSRY